MLFYQWQKQLFENGTAAFERTGKSKRPTVKKRRIEKIQAELMTKNEIIADLMEKKSKAKKVWGTLNGCWVSRDTRD